MTLFEIEEALGHMLEMHSEDERGDIPNPEGLVDELYMLKLRPRAPHGDRLDPAAREAPVSNCVVCGRGKNTIANSIVDLGDGLSARMCTECGADRFRRTLAREIVEGKPLGCECGRCGASVQRGRV